MELEKITENVFFIRGAVNIGLVKNGTDCVLIDSGIDDEAGKKILRLLESQKLSLKAIINTHSHADHCGANAFLQKETGCEIFAPETEAQIIENPFLEPLYFFSGAEPIPELKNRFLMAEKSKVTAVLQPGISKIAGISFEMVPLKGHSPNQCGVAVENVLFCGDSVFSAEVLEKHKLPFFSGIGETKKTLGFLSKANFSFFVPCHAEPVSDIRELAELNLKNIIEIEERILYFLKEEMTAEQALQSLCDYFGIKLKSAQQFFLFKTIVLAFLGDLYSSKKISFQIDQNLAKWKRISLT